MSVLYRITSPAGKSYIGVAKHSAEARFKKHVRDSKGGRQTALCGAIRKYGAEAMQVETLLVATSEYCFQAEIKAISVFGTLAPNGYNMTTGGEGVHEMDEESKRRHRASVNAPEVRAAKSAASKVHRNTKEAKEATSALMHKRWETSDWQSHFSKCMKDKWKDPEYRAKIFAKVAKQCLLCGNDFECTVRQAFKAKYCCASCKAKHHRQMAKQFAVANTSYDPET